MDKQYAQISGGTVVNIVVAQESPGEDYVETPTSLGVGVDYRYDSATSSFSEPETPEATLEDNKITAISMLRSTDWTQLPDSGLSTSCVNAFSAYRLFARNFLQNPTSGNISWPEIPAEEYA